MGLWLDWKNVMFDPQKFYKKLPAKEKYRKATIFYLTIEAIGTALVLLAFISFIFLGLMDDTTMGFFKSTFMSGLGTGLLTGILVLAFPIIILFSWGILYIGSAIVHLFVLLFGGKKGFVETFKANAYAAAPGIFSFIPWIGNVATVYSIILLIIGIKERQQLSLGKSIAAVLIPIGIVLLLIIALMAAFFLMSNISPYIEAGGFTP